jgi:putative membrane protein
MTDPQATATPDRFEVRVTADSHFAWIRTRLSVERTMMAALRTAVSLIGFGFAIFQFLQRFDDLPGALPARHPQAPQYLGLSLIFCGVLLLLISIWQYWWTIRYLWHGAYASIAGMTKEGLRSPLVAVAILLVGVGLFAFFAVLLRLA